jgi:hypothetical protein
MSSNRFLVATLVAFTMCESNDGIAKGDKTKPVSHEERTIAGWTVQIDQGLLATQEKSTEHALKLLEIQLKEIARDVPQKAVTELRKVTLWFTAEYPGIRPRAEYHPDVGWLREHGRNPAMAKGVEFTNVRIFAEEMDRMPNFALHELAHAYHDRFLPKGFQNSSIKQVYEAAMQSGRYERVERWHGKRQSNTFERAYAMTTPQEYFAETTEAYFSRNDFFPFNKEDLKQFDQNMFRLLGNLWAIDNSQSSSKTRP